LNLLLLQQECGSSEANLLLMVFSRDRTASERASDFRETAKSENEERESVVGYHESGKSENGDAGEEPSLPFLQDSNASDREDGSSGTSASAGGSGSASENASEGEKRASVQV
jgi:hypothetical protein